MPNWCVNEIYIYHKHPGVLHAIKLLIDVEEPFQAIYPVPPGTADGDTYTWRVDNWGTKWEPEGWGVAGLRGEHQCGNTRDDPDYLSDGGCVRVGCSTAWAPPIGVLRRLSARFPDAVIVVLYEEDGAPFTGGAVLSGGAVLAEEHRDMGKNDWPQNVARLGAWDSEDNPDFVPLCDRFPSIDAACRRALNPPPPSPREYPTEDTDEARAARRRAARAALTGATPTPTPGETP